MTEFATVIFWLLAVLAISQLLLSVVFARALTRAAPPRLPDAECPNAAVVLCLRGSDPFLADTVTALLAQDYPNFEVRIVIDQRNDPAWSVVEEVLRDQDSTHVRVEALENRRKVCSLKCSSVLQAVEGLDDSCGIVAQLDADTIPHPTWLRELAAALAPESVGVATGNRWYFPERPSWGALVRYAWNVAAVVQMYFYGIAWGGTLAVKTSTLRESGILDRWRNAFCEDTMLYAILRPLKLRVAFVPSLMMINREDCTISSCDHWVRRQLLTARLYHPLWPAVVGHGATTSAALFCGMVLCVIAAIQGNNAAASLHLGGVATYQVAMLISLAMIELAVRRVARARNESSKWLKPIVFGRLLLVIPLTQIIYARALAAAMFLRTVHWRGVKYRVDGPWKIRLIEEKGQPELGAMANSSESL